MKLLAIFCGVILLSLHSIPANSQRSIDPEIQKIIEEFIENEYFPASDSAAAGITIVKDDGKVLYTTALGLADAEKGIPATNDTQFTIASVSKSFTGMLTAKVLSERFPHLGVAALDTPIRRLLPDFNLTLIDRYRSEHITFRDLLTHRVCVEANDAHILSGQLSSTEELVFRARYNQAREKSSCNFREGSSYNNQMVATAAYLAGLVANKSYEDAFRDFFDDMGMTNTTLVKSTDDYTNLPHRAMPHYYKDGKFHVMNGELTKRLAVAAGSGGVTTTPNDVAKYLRMIINNGEVDGKQVIPKEVLSQWLRSPTFDGFANYKRNDGDISFIQNGYVLGLVSSTYDGWQTLSHLGYAPPYYSQIMMYPDLKLGMFSVTNTGPPLAAHYALQMFIFEVLQGNLNTARERALKFANTVKLHEKGHLRKEVGLPETLVQKSKSKALKKNSTVRLTGKFGSGTLGELEISEKFNEKTNQTQLYVEYGIWFRGWLQEQDEEGRFPIKWETDIVQDIYVVGLTEEDQTSAVYLLDEDTIVFAGPLTGGKFQRGVSLDKLPLIPWEPGSC